MGLAGKDSLRLNWHLLSLLFSVNHGCATTPLIFATSLLTKEMGFIGSALLYVFTCLCALFLSAPVVITVGQRAGLALAMGLYSVFVGSFALAMALPEGCAEQWATFLTGSCLGGAAASILWVAQGAYLDRSVAAWMEAEGSGREATTALHTSVFAVYYLLLEVVLKLLCSVALAHVAPWTVFAVFAALAAVSTLGVLVLMDFGAQDGASQPACAGKLLAAVALWCAPQLWCLSLTNLTFGFAAAFLNGYVNASYTKPQLGKDWVGYFATATALTAAVLSRLFGAAAVHLGTKGPFILIGSVCFAAIPALVLTFNLDAWRYWLVVPYVLQGCGRAVYESTNRGVFADFFPGPQAQGAFANQMMQSTLSFTLCFFFSAVLPRPVLASIVLGLAGLTYPCFLLARRFAAGEDPSAAKSGSDESSNEESNEDSDATSDVAD